MVFTNIIIKILTLMRLIQDSTKTRMSERMARIPSKLYKEVTKLGKNTLKRVEIDAGFSKNKHSIAWTKMAVMLEQISRI